MTGLIKACSNTSYTLPAHLTRHGAKERPVSLQSIADQSQGHNFLTHRMMTRLVPRRPKQPATRSEASIPPSPPAPPPTHPHDPSRIVAQKKKRTELHPKHMDRHPQRKEKRKNKQDLINRGSFLSFAQKKRSRSDRFIVYHSFNFHPIPQSPILSPPFRPGILSLQFQPRPALAGKGKKRRKKRLSRSLPIRRLRFPFPFPVPTPP